MKINEFAEPTGAAVKFPNKGDTVSGVITHIGEPRDGVNPNNDQPETQVRILLEVDGEEDPQALYVRTKPSHQIARAIADAVRAAGSDEILPGGKLTVQFYDEEDVGKPSKLKKFRAKYEPPAKSAKVDDWGTEPAKPNNFPDF